MAIETRIREPVPFRKAASARMLTVDERTCLLAPHLVNYGSRPGRS
jgi:hypothetical protein